MNTRIANMKVRGLVLAVGAAVGTMHTIAASADDERAALMVPTNSMEIGVLYTPQSSYKFGEYSGIDKSGGYLNGNFNIRGGDSYGSETGTMRYQLYGSDLGLTSRNVGVSLSDQGKWSVGVTYDQLTHYTADSYQTPYSGNMGGDIYTLPGGFGNVANTRLMSSAQLGAFHNLNINNNRDNISLNSTYVINRQWNVKFDLNHLDQSGAKLQGFGASTFGGAAGERESILPMPTNSRTETANLALNWVGDKSHATIAYFGSFYRDNNNGISFGTWSSASNLQQMYGTYPSNNYQQASVTGGYTFSPRTKLAGGLSYSYNTQDSAYNYDITGVMVTPSPTASLNGSVQTLHADLKLTDQTTKNLLLSAGIKYDDRDNRTSSNIYNARAINGANIYNYPNTPLSIKRTAVELAGDYRFDMRQKIRVALTYDQIDRQCNQYAVGGGTPAYAGGTNCVTATSTRDPKFNATYRLKANDDLNFNLGYGFSARRTSFDENARAAMIDIGGNYPLLPATTTGLNGGDWRGFHPYFEASRNQNMLKAGTNWQATPQLSFTGNMRYTDDDYLSTWGVQKGHAWGIDADATYQYREQGAITVYLTQQQRTRDVTDLQRSPFQAPTATLPSGASFSNNLRDSDTSVGVNVKQGGLMSGKLDIAGDLTYSLGKSEYYTQLNYALLSGAPCTDPTVLSCGSLPTIRNEMIQFKLNGTYSLDKKSKLALGYLYRSLRADDFLYNGLQNGYTPSGVMPTNQQAPSYHVNMVFASYIYTFK